MAISKTSLRNKKYQLNKLIDLIFATRTPLTSNGGNISSRLLEIATISYLPFIDNHTVRTAFNSGITEAAEQLKQMDPKNCPVWFIVDHYYTVVTAMMYFCNYSNILKESLTEDILKVFQAVSLKICTTNLQMNTFLLKAVVLGASGILAIGGDLVNTLAVSYVEIILKCLVRLKDKANIEDKALDESYDDLDDELEKKKKTTGKRLSALDNFEKKNEQYLRQMEGINEIDEFKRFRAAKKMMESRGDGKVNEFIMSTSPTTQMFLIKLINHKKVKIGDFERVRLIYKNVRAKSIYS